MPASSGALRGGGEEGLGRLVQRLVAQAGAVLDLQLEAADRAEALHRRRREDGDERVLDAGERPFSVPGDGAAGRGPAWSGPRTRSSATNTMPALELLVKPLIDRPGKATVCLRTRLLQRDVAHPPDHASRCGRGWRRPAAARSRPGIACPAAARSRRARPGTARRPAPTRPRYTTIMTRLAPDHALDAAAIGVRRRRRRPG